MAEGTTVAHQWSPYDRKRLAAIFSALRATAKFLRLACTVPQDSPVDAEAVRAALEFCVQVLDAKPRESPSLYDDLVPSAHFVVEQLLALLLRRFQGTPLAPSAVSMGFGDNRQAFGVAKSSREERELLDHFLPVSGTSVLEVLAGRVQSQVTQMQQADFFVERATRYVLRELQWRRDA